jgi:glycosyltransferase involved in cell wall biosynthesis
MPALFRKSHTFLFTSIRDTFGSVVLEAMAHGLPVIALDHQGVSTHLPRTAVIKFPLSNPETTVKNFAEGIRTLMDHPDLRRQMRAAAWAFAKDQTWSRRAEEMSDIYKSI